MVWAAEKRIDFGMVISAPILSISLTVRCHTFLIMAFPS
jgi:hypothetical protein